MSREVGLYLEDILGAIDKVAAYVSGKTLQDLQRDTLLIDAVAFNLIVVGEAAGKVPPEIRSAYPEVPWSQVVGLRNIIAHKYFGLDLEIVWDVVQNELPTLQQVVERIKKVERE
jgi:uncharacterized protein with HEPN domain